MEAIEQQPQTDDSLSYAVGVSVALHVALVLFFVVKAAFFTAEPIDFSAAVKVDLVGLPDKVQKITAPPKAPPAAAKKEPEPVVKLEKKEVAPPVAKVVLPKKEPDAINLEKVKSKERNALDKLKTMDALDKIKEDLAKEQQKKSAAAAAASAVAEEGPPAKIKGNVLSPGTALTGLSKLQHDTYLSDLDQHIKANWALPEWLANRDLKAQVKVYIDARGLIISRRIFKSSGNPSYDAEALATIDRSAPFPPPPEKFASMVEVDGILIGFPE